MMDVFLRKKPCKMIALLKERQNPMYISELAKESGATYVHVTKLLRELEQSGIIVLEKNGKKKMVKLTSEGTKIAGLVTELTGALNATSNNGGSQLKQS
jgi:predicted transcriptional regulator